MTREMTREGTAHAEIRPATPPIRYHYMDNLRALAMLAGIFFHAALAYTPLVSQIWLPADAGQSTLMGAVAWFSHLFRMPLFFLIAGFFAAYLIDKRGIAGLLKNRALRIALPFVLFLPVIWVTLGMGVGWALQNVQHPSPILQMAAMAAQMPDPPAPPVTTTHLWFLYVLVQFTLVYAVIERTGLLDRPWAAVLTKPAFVLGVMPLLLVPALLSVAAPTPAPEQFVPQAWAFGFFGLFYLFGTRLFQQQDALDALAPHAAWAAPLGIALYVGLFTMYPTEVSLADAMAVAGGMPFSWNHALMAVLEAYIAVTMTIACLVYGRRWLNRANPAMRLVADSSYWIYIIHLPVLFMIQYALLDVEWNLWVKFVAASLGTLGIGLVSYLALVRWTPIGWLLNGRRSRKAQDRVDAAEPAPLSV